MYLTLSTLRSDGYEACGEDVVDLSPLDYSHVNLLGRYELALPNSIAGARSGRCAISRRAMTTHHPLRSEAYRAYLFR